MFDNFQQYLAFPPTFVDFSNEDRDEETNIISVDVKFRIKTLPEKLKLWRKFLIKEIDRVEQNSTNGEKVMELALLTPVLEWIESQLTEEEMAEPVSRNLDFFD